MPNLYTSRVGGGSTRFLQTSLAALALGLCSLTALAEPGLLRITTSPGDAPIFINGQRKGNSPSEEGQSFAVKLAQGEYTVEARKSDGQDYSGKKERFYCQRQLANPEPDA